MNLSHYTAEPLTLDRSRTYEQDEASFMRGKPRGFWVSVDGEDDWAEWCRTEEFRLDSLAHRTTFKIAESARVATLSSVADILAFQDQYGKLRLAQIPDEFYPDWSAVAADGYDGVVIAPYQWEARLSVAWYYTWDCASGCIWNLDALELVTEPALS